MEQREVLDPSVVGVDAGEADFVEEAEGGSFERILRATFDAETVDSAVEVGLDEEVVPYRGRGWCRSSR